MKTLETPPYAARDGIVDYQIECWKNRQGAMTVKTTDWQRVFQLRKTFLLFSCPSVDSVYYFLLYPNLNSDPSNAPASLNRSKQVHRVARIPSCSYADF